MPDRNDSSPTALAPDQPTRSADQNQSLADTSETSADGMLLPSLNTGITLLDIDDDRGIPLLQSLVLDHLFLHDGPAFWVDSHGHATTTTLARIAPSQRLLNRIHVARGFTAYQHYSLICELSTAVENATNGADRSTDASTQAPHQGVGKATEPSLLVVPYLDAQYRGEDSLAAKHAETLQARILAALGTYATEYDVPVLVTRRKQDDFSSPIAMAADRRLQCEQTEKGPRIVGEDFETALYPTDDGSYYQTTFAYWRQMLTTRAKQVGVNLDTSPASVGTEEPAGATPDPLMDAWMARNGGR